MKSNIKFIQGNEACVEGAMYAGLRFFAGYPITPSTEIAETYRTPVILLFGEIPLVVEMNTGQVMREVKAAVKNPENVFLANRIDGTLITPTDIRNILRLIQGRGV
jgi:pyruvate/2-oxoacid:ferredoxin oxidoreductase alpha subunit